MLISTRAWTSRVSSALGREPQSIREALEGLRLVLSRDEVAKREVEASRRGGYRFERFSRSDRAALVTWAAMKELLRGIPREETASKMVVRKDDRFKEEVKGPRPVGSWESPEGKTYSVFPWDVPPLRKGAVLRHPQYGEGYIAHILGDVVIARFSKRDRRLAWRAAARMVEDPYLHRIEPRVGAAAAWLRGFLASGEEVRGMNRLEHQEAFDSPHFDEGLLPPELLEALEKAGLAVGEPKLEVLERLVALLPSKEEELWELLNTYGQQLPKGWTAAEAAAAIKKLSRKAEEKARLWGLLKEVSALRWLRRELEATGHSPILGVAYRAEDGEVVYTAPVYGAV